MKIFVNPRKKNFSRSVLFQVKTRISLEYFLTDCSWKPFFDSNSPPDLFKSNFFDNFGNSKAFHIVLT